MAEEIYHIFDKVFKKVLTLSSKAVINLINGLFGTDHPLDSTITYNQTEFEDDNLKKILADTILTINGRNSYHLEAQRENDNSIVFRVFEYGFGHANRTRKMVILIPFHVLKLLYAIEKGKFDDLDELQRYILNDIMAMTISLACKGEIVSRITSVSS